MDVLNRVKLKLKVKNYKTKTAPKNGAVCLNYIGLFVVNDTFQLEFESQTELCSAKEVIDFIHLETKRVYRFSIFRLHRAVR